MQMKILVTGGVGYIGSHMCVELLNAGHDIVIVDNLCNSFSATLNKIKLITNRSFEFYESDLCDKDKLINVFRAHQFDGVIHFAGLKAVGESACCPLKYFSNNITGTLNLLEMVQKYSIRNFVFSSSAAVYSGNLGAVPLKETFPLSTSSPYARSKLIIENMLRDICSTRTELNVVILRYFNPVGAHESGLIGEEPVGVPNNLIPYIAQVAAGIRSMLSIYGGDYPTKDGTGVRDYIHVMDLVRGHIMAMKKIDSKRSLSIYNLGTGKAHSVLEVITAFEQVSGKEIPFQIVERRAGDTAICYADPTLAMKELGWIAKYDLQKMCEDTWHWQQKTMTIPPRIEGL